MKNRTLEEYQRRFSNPELCVNAPGRANIIGEHTDYNQGLVLPFAIEQSIDLVIGTNSKKLLRVYALDTNEYQEVPLVDLKFLNKGWIRYFVNSLVVVGLKDFSGIDVVFSGDLPQGAGLSSSSAITCGFLAGINDRYSLQFTVDQIIDLASQAENGIGLKGGMMDQTAIMKAQKDHALKIDFLDFSTEQIPLPSDSYTFYIFNSGQKHNLVETEYNQRRASCEEGLIQMQAKNPRIKSFRDVQPNDLQHISDPVIKRRCRHAIDENKRVLKSVALLKTGEIKGLGALINASHESLSALYEVSTAEIDFLVQKSRAISNHLGGRIMGGGFGGSTINIFQGELDRPDIETLKQIYFDTTGYNLEIIRAKSGDGLTVDKL